MLPGKAQDSFFSICLFPLVWNFDSKIVLLDADKLVTSDVILQNFFSSLELSPEGQGMVNG